MLRWASRTSASVENCCRTPPIAFDVAPPATEPRSQSTTSSAPSSARWYATDAPAAPAPATTIRANDRAPGARLPSVRAAAPARLRESGRHAARGRAWPRRERKSLDPFPERAEIRPGHAADRGSDLARKGGRQPGNRPRGAGAQARRDQGLRPDEDV